MLSQACTVSIQELKKNCSNCNLKELCMPVGLKPDELDRLDALVSIRRKVSKGESLFRTGEGFSSLYAVKTGTFKTLVNNQDGTDQVIGFQMTGELL